MIANLSRSTRIAVKHLLNTVSGELSFKQLCFICYRKGIFFDQIKIIKDHAYESQEHFSRGCHQRHHRCP